MDRVELWVLYEDSIVGGAAFTPHTFVLRCLHDDLGGDFWELEQRVACRPMNGSSKLRKECQALLPRVAGHAGLVAVYDRDKIHKLLDVAKADICHGSAAIALSEGCAPVEKLKVVLLADNLETVLAAIGACSGDSRVDDAVRKNRNARDLVFQRASLEGARSLRIAVRAAVPSLDYLVRGLAKRLRR